MINVQYIIVETGLHSCPRRESKFSVCVARYRCNRSRIDL